MALKSSSRPGKSGNQNASLEFAVLILLLQHRGKDSILLTQRTARLPRYAGHVSFPGGAREPGDGSLESTALRETFEEVGIPQDRIEIFAELEWFETTLGDRVKPFAGKLQGPFDVHPDPEEVERVLYLPVSTVEGDPFKVREQFRDRDGKTHSVYTFEFEGVEIWGLTARILRRAFVESQLDTSEGRDTEATLPA